MSAGSGLNDEARDFIDFSEGEGFWEVVEEWEESSRHEDGGDDELPLDGSLNIGGSDSGEVGGNEGSHE